jgi:hypothetical protein
MCDAIYEPPLQKITSSTTKYFLLMLSSRSLNEKKLSDWRMKTLEHTFGEGSERTFGTSWNIRKPLYKLRYRVFHRFVQAKPNLTRRS